jgi:hypothetical protein
MSCNTVDSNTVFYQYTMKSLIVFYNQDDPFVPQRTVLFIVLRGSTGIIFTFAYNGNT